MLMNIIIRSKSMTMQPWDTDKKLVMQIIIPITHRKVNIELNTIKHNPHSKSSIRKFNVLSMSSHNCFVF